MEEQFRAALMAGVSALTTRVGWGEVPQGSAMPYVVLWGIGDAAAATLDGPEGMSQGRVQVDCYGLTYGQAKQLARAVRAAMDGFRGNGLKGVFLAGTRDTREGGSNEAIRPFRVSLDFIVNFHG